MKKSELRQIIREEISRLNESALFYDSNLDKTITPKEKGWYASFKTKSGDFGYSKLPSKPVDKNSALRMLKNINPDEEYSFVIKISEII
jgi:hypothetical protein